MGLLDWFRGRDSIQRSVVNSALDAVDREETEVSRSGSEEPGYYPSENFVITEATHRASSQIMDLDPIVRRALKEVGNRTWGKNNFLADFPPGRFSMAWDPAVPRTASPVGSTYIAARSWGVGNKSSGNPGRSECYEVTAEFDTDGSFVSWWVEGQPRRPAPMTVESLAADLAEAYRSGPSEGPFTR